MDFETALGRLKRGAAVARGGWRDIKAVRMSSERGGMLLALPTDDDFATPWTPNHVDLFSNDWFEVSSAMKGDARLDHFLRASL